MSVLKNYTRKTYLGNINISPIKGDTKPADSLSAASDIVNLNLPENDEFTSSEVQDEDIANYQFVVDGQECICFTDTILPKTKKCSKPL